MRILKSPFKRTERLRFSADGGMLIGSGIARTQWTPPKTTRGMFSFDLPDEHAECFLPEAGVQGFQPLPDGERLLIVASGNIVLWNLIARRIEAHVPVDLYGVAFSPDGCGVVHWSTNSFILRPLNLARLIREETTWRRACELGWAINHLAYSPDGTAILACLMKRRANSRKLDSRLDFLSPVTGDLLRSYPLTLQEVRRIAVSPDQSRLALLTGHTLVCGSFDDFGQTVTILNDTASCFSDIAFHPSSRLLAAASNDQTIKFYETDSWTPLGTFTWNSGKMRSVAFSPDGLVAAAGSSTGQVVLWDVDF